MNRRASTSRPDPAKLRHPEPAHHAGHPRTVAILEDAEFEAEADQPFEEGSHDQIDADLRHRLISEAAFELYQRRGFADGYDLDDWLQAEEQVDHLLLQRPTEAVPETEGRNK